MTLNVNLRSAVSVMRIVTKWPELSDFQYKVPLHLSYRHIKFDDEI